MKKREPVILIDEKKALGLYFDNLFEDEPKVEIEPRSPSETASVFKPMPEAITIEPESKTQSETELQWRPRTSFKTLTLKVRDTHITLPIDGLKSIATWPLAMNRLPGRPDWNIGMFSFQSKQVNVVDITQLLKTVDDIEPYADKKTDEFTHIAIVENGQWGIACGELSSVTSLSPEDIKWRKYRNKYPWVAGTVVGKMCLLIDVEQFSGYLASVA